MNSKTRLLASALTAGLLAGCATVGPNFTAPKSDAAPGYAMKGDAQPGAAQIASGAGPAADWWRGLGSSDLDRVIRQGLSDSPTLVEADAALLQAQDAAAATRGELGPQAALTANAVRERINFASYGITVFPNPTLYAYSVGAGVSYDLDLFGGRRRQIESLQAKAQAEGYRAGAAYLSLTGNIALRAVEIATLRAEIAAAHDVIAGDQGDLDLAHRAVEAGGAPRASQVSVNAQLAQDQALLPGLQQQLAQTRHALALLVGHAPADWSAPDFDLDALSAPANVPVELPSELASRRPDILAAEAEVHAATAQIGVQTAKLYPDISLTANFAQTALQPEKLFQYAFSGWSAGPGLSLPLAGRDAIRSRRQQAEQEAREALARYQETVLQAFTQVSDALSAIANDDQQIQAEAAAQAAAESHMKNARFAFSNGGGTMLDITDAEREVSRAKLGYAQAQGRRLSDVVRLYMATGTDWRAAEAARRTGLALNR